MSSTTPASKPHTPAEDGEHKVSNFLRQIIEHDLAAGTYASRQWAGSPGDAAHHAAGQPDPAKIRTRFPPEPNGYLHVGHAKSICLNFGLARDYGGVCHLRFDDTNPEKEDTEYVDSIIDAVKWLGFDWQAHGETHLYQASDYFDFMYRAAEYLVEAGHAYVDEQTAEQMRVNRGDFGKPGVDSPFRSRTPAENLARFREMRDGQHEDGSMVLRAKIDMASPNINLRDPAIYRIRRATHHNTGDTWCIYPMYTYAHPIEDALEQITHSFCTLEFEDQRPFYDWLLERLCEGGLLKTPPPRQYEFARLNLTYVITSKRKLAQLVYDHKVNGWDDPRMPTIVGLRRRGYTPESIQLFADRIGVTKSDSWIDYSTLEGCLREDLENKAHRGMAVLDPVKLVLTNWGEVFGSDDHTEDCTQPALPHSAIAEGQTPPPDRTFKIGKAVWIEREDFEEVPPKGYKRLYPPQKTADGPASSGAVVRLKGGYVIECTGYEMDESDTVTAVHAKVIPGTKSGTPGADSVKAKAAITWVSAADGVPAEVRLYDRLFIDPQPDAGGKDFTAALNPDSLRVVTAFVEPSLAAAKPDQKFQFERHGYFVADRLDHREGVKAVFNRVAALKDNWAAPAEVKPTYSGLPVVDVRSILDRISQCPALPIEPLPHFAVSLETKPSKFVTPLLRILNAGSDQSPFLIISAAGAVGKSALAKYIANQKNALLWDLGKQDLGDSVVKGTLLELFGFDNASTAARLIGEGKLPVIVDAIDEAEVRSGESRIEKTIQEFSDLVKDCKKPTIILLARTETAQYLKNLLSDSETLKAEIPMYEIDFFNREKSIEFIHYNVNDTLFTKPVVAEFVRKAEKAIAQSLSVTSDKPWSNEKFGAFMGYAPVLQAAASLFDNETNPKKIVEEFSDENWISKAKGSKFLSSLIDLLLDREQKKLVEPIKAKININIEPHEVDWRKLYDRNEQLTRLAAKYLAGVDGYSSGYADQLPPDLKKEYELSVAAFLPQHPFMRGNEFASSVFKDYLLAWSLKNVEFKQDAETYIGSNPTLTPTLFSLYGELPGHGSTAHIGALIDSFFARSYGIEADSQALVVEKPDKSVELTIWTGSKAGVSESNRLSFPITNDRIKLGSKVRNTIVVCSLDVEIGLPNRPSDINTANIIASGIHFQSRDIHIRSREGSDHVLLSASRFDFQSPGATILCADKKRLVVYSNNPLSHQLKSFQINSTRYISNAKLSSAHENLVRIVRWFRKDGKEEFARYKDLIDNIAVGGDEERKALLEHLKKANILQTRGSLYAITSQNINKYGLSWDANISNINPQLEALLLQFIAARPNSKVILESGIQKKD